MDIQFLKKIYTTNCSDGDYIFLSTKKGDSWKDHPIKYTRKTIKKSLTEFADKYPDKEYDLYFSPVPFSAPSRQVKNAKDTKYLIQDIDETPLDSIEIQPTYVWKTSPSKHQGMWELDRYIGSELYSKVNPFFAHTIGADSASDVCHVYRIPSTRNHKYKNTPKVGKPTTKEGQTLYRWTQFKKDIFFDERKKASSSTGKSTKIKVPKSSSKRTKRILKKYDVPDKVLELLDLDDTDGLDRSEMLWYIENTLINEVGMQPAEVISVIKSSVFNKYSGRRNEDEQLSRELRKVLEGKVSTTIKKKKKKKKGNRLVTTSYTQLRTDGNIKPEWIVKGFWNKSSNGMVAGLPKSYKSTVTMDLAISVASGRPFLGIYPVEQQGRVLLIQNENAESILNDRLHKMTTARGLGGHVEVKDNHLVGKMPTDLPITFVNNQGFNLSSEEDREDFEDLLKRERPVLAILDPLYLMFTGDMNSSQDLTPILNFLNQMRDKYGTAIMLIHHYNKGSSINSAQKGGQRMAGSVFLHGWIENAWYFEKVKDEDTNNIELEFTREFRGAGGYPELTLHLLMGNDEGDDTYYVEVFEDGAKINFNTQVQTATKFFKDYGNKKVLSTRFIKQELALDKITFEKILKKLLKRNTIKRVKGGYRYNEAQNWVQDG